MVKIACSSGKRYIKLENDLVMKEERLNLLNSCLSAIQDAHDVLEEVRDEEEEAYDNMPEGLQDSERGDLMQDAIDNIDEAICSLDDVITSLEEVVFNADNPDVMEVELWKNLKVGDKVKHKSFGIGVITDIDGKYYFINFQNKTSKFIFPDAIDNGFIMLIK